MTPLQRVEPFKSKFATTLSGLRLVTMSDSVKLYAEGMHPEGGLVRWKGSEYHMIEGRALNFQDMRGDKHMVKGSDRPLLNIDFSYTRRETDRPTRKATKRTPAKPLKQSKITPKCHQVTPIVSITCSEPGNTKNQWRRPHSNCFNMCIRDSELHCINSEANQKRLEYNTSYCRRACTRASGIGACQLEYNRPRVPVP